MRPWIAVLVLVLLAGAGWSVSQLYPSIAFTKQGSVFTVVGGTLVLTASSVYPINLTLINDVVNASLFSCSNGEILMANSSGGWNCVHISSEAALALFFQNVSSDIAEYDKMNTTHSARAEQEIAVTVAADGTQIMQFITDSGVPNQDFIPAGVHVVHLHAKQDSTTGRKIARLWANIYVYNSSGTTLLGSTELSNPLTASSAEYVFHSALSDFDVSPADRIAVNVSANLTGLGVNPVVSIYLEGLTASRYELPVILNLTGGTTTTGGFAYNGSFVWGLGSGNIADQTDLQNLLNQKVNHSSSNLTGNWTEILYCKANASGNWSNQLALNQSLFGNWTNSLAINNTLLGNWSNQLAINNTLLGNWTNQLAINGTLLGNWSQQLALNQSLYGNWTEINYCKANLTSNWSNSLALNQSWYGNWSAWISQFNSRLVNGSNASFGNASVWNNLTASNATLGNLTVRNNATIQNATFGNATVIGNLSVQSLSTDGCIVTAIRGNLTCNSTVIGGGGSVDTSNLVPYVGATRGLNLSTYSLNATNANVSALNASTQIELPGKVWNASGFNFSVSPARNSLFDLGGNTNVWNSTSTNFIVMDKAVFDSRVAGTVGLNGSMCVSNNLNVSGGTIALSKAGTQYIDAELGNLYIRARSATGGIMFHTYGADRAYMTDAAFYPNAASGLDLGTTTKPFGSLYLTGQIGTGPAPATNVFATSVGTTTYPVSTIYGTTEYLGGQIAKYNGITTEGYGVPAIMDDVNLSGQVSSIAQTNLTNCNTAGKYLVSYYLSGGSTGSSPTVTVSIDWTDYVQNRIVTSATVTPNTYAQDTIYVQLAAGGIRYSTTVNNMRYQLAITATRVA